MTAIDTGQRFTAKPISGAPFGWEVDVDLGTTLGAKDQEALRQIYLRDGLVLLRNQKLSMEQQIEACSIFGPVLRNSRENYIVSNVHEDGFLGDRELLFHNDVPYVPAPYLGGSLHALEVDSGVSATRFASNLRAWNRLSEDLKQRIENLNALHIKGRSGQRTRMTDLEPGDNCAVHALVGCQKETGRRYIFIFACIEMTGFVIGMPEVEGEELQQELFAHMYQSEETYEHQWQKGDLVVWDNLAVQHARSQVSGGVRTLQRVTIAEYGYWDQYPVDLPTYDALKKIARPRPFRRTEGEH